VVENNFDILKKTFRELMIKFNLNVFFLLDVVIVCCCINLHNMILNGKDANIDELMVELKAENLGENRHGGMRPNFDDQTTNQ
jgi:hypothetical protein